MKKKSLKKIFFISDLHFGTDKINDFRETLAMHKFLEKVEKEGEKLVLLGDIFELLQCEILEIYLQHKILIDHFFELSKKIPIVLVFGNHDHILSAFWNLESEKSNFFGSKIKIATEFIDKNRKIFASHGHQFDKFNRKGDILNPKDPKNFGDRIARIAGFLEKYIHPKADDFLEHIYKNYRIFLKKLHLESKKISNLITPKTNSYLELGGDFSEFEQGAKNILKSNDYNLVLMGHTHHFEVKKFSKNNIYINTGSWVSPEEPPTFVEIEEKTARICNAKNYNILEEVEFDH